MRRLVVKDKELKKRAVYVYLPSVEMAEKWKELAEKAGTPISKFVLEHVEDSLREEGGEGYPRRAELIKQIKELKTELSKLRDETSILRRAYERLDLELKRYRTQPFLEEEYKGIRKYDQELVALLKKRRMVSSDELLQELRIDPREKDLVKAVSRQLENLEAYGLAEATPKGWRWRG